jgi:hypothetical protein
MDMPPLLRARPDEVIEWRPRNVVKLAERIPSCRSRERQFDDILAPVNGG